jgi:hypothetical protein
MKTLLLLFLLLNLLNKADLQGTYSYCCFNCYELNLNNDSTFKLTEKSGEWDITRISEGNYKIVSDTILLLREKNKRFQSNIQLDTINDKLESYRFHILINGDLKSESFFCMGSIRQNVYSYFKKN